MSLTSRSPETATTALDPCPSAYVTASSPVSTSGDGPMSHATHTSLPLAPKNGQVVTPDRNKKTEPRGRGRRPADEVRTDVLDAVGNLLLTAGSADLTFERAARAAGVSKTTLYKWRPSKGALALDGYFHAVEETLAFPDTGDIRADLLTQLRAFAHVMTHTTGGRILTELIGESQTDEDLATVYRKLYSSHRRRLAAERLR